MRLRNARVKSRTESAKVHRLEIKKSPILCNTASLPYNEFSTKET